jgi:hypothetical protein
LSTAPRTDGNWRRVQSVGIGGLGLAGTVVLFAGLVLIVVGFMLSLYISIAAALLTVALLGPMMVKDRHHRNLFQNTTARVAWATGRSAGHHLYRSGPLSRVPKGRCALPGVMASMTATEAKDAYGRRFALLCHKWVSHVSVVLTTSPDGAALVDQAQVDNWVAHWGAWLANLANEPGLVGASVIIDAAPDPGTRLRQEVTSHRSGTATALSRQVMAQVIEQYPTGSAAITCRVALTWSMASRAQPGKKRTIEEMALDIGHRLPSLTASLATTGAGPARPLAVSEVAAAVRVAFEPGLLPAIEDVGAGAAGIEWQDAGPTATQESWDRYRHDGAVSVSWMMSEPPRGHVFSGVLNGLLAPHPDIARKRVALLYRPYDTAAAVKVVESDRRDAIFAASGRKVARARDALSVQAAERSAEEEAIGAGVVRFGMVVTATVLDPAQLPMAVSVVDTLATTSRLRLRRAYGCQAATFAAGLPLGRVSAAHLRVPQTLREAM